MKKLNITSEIQEALKQGRPVVALESTIIAHGMPYPQNVNTALEVEAIVREQGAIPATIAILKGQIQIGLTSAQLDYLGKAENVWKVSLRDMPFVIAQGLDGATTVAATMRLASIAGIKVFVTGGIGGVHKGADKSMDISADLTEMSNTNVAVVAAGVKSILDIGLTLEVLETLGVPVVTFGSKDFPSFYSRKSGYNSPLQLNSAKEIAAMLNVKWELGLEGSVLIANPIPAEHEIPYQEMEKHITEALRLADEQKISGKKITPFLLQNLNLITGSKSLNANIALIKNNAMLGGRVAVSLAGF